ncbi:MAG: hypothetical protein ACOCXX_01215, partial [Planctomycetota bacterium]
MDDREGHPVLAMHADGLPLYFKPPRVYVLDKVWDNPQAAARAERFCSYLPEAEQVTYSMMELPDIVVQEKLDHRPQMGELAVVPPPIPFLTMYDFNRQRVAETERKLAEAYTGDGT